jgi:uncharacterized OB-fold protein
MAYFSPEMPAPHPNMDDAGFWDACREQRLRFQACGSCGAVRNPPAPICGQCHSTETTWVGAPSRAALYTFTVVHHASHSAVVGQLPYVAAVVEFPELPGVRLISNVTGVGPAELRIGMPLQLWWDDIGDGMMVPRFKPVSANTGI